MRQLLAIKAETHRSMCCAQFSFFSLKLFLEIIANHNKALKTRVLHVQTHMATVVKHYIEPQDLSLRKSMLHAQS